MFGIVLDGVAGLDAVDCAIGSVLVGTLVDAESSAACDDELGVCIGAAGGAVDGALAGAEGEAVDDTLRAVLDKAAATVPAFAVEVVAADACFVLSTLVPNEPTAVDVDGTVSCVVSADSLTSSG